MNAWWKNFILIALIAATPTAAAAQGRVPTTNSGAIGGDVGVFLARDAELATGLTLEGTLHPPQRRNAGGSFGDSESKLGGTPFGGVEIFTSPTVAVKAEGRYHIVPRTFGLDPDGFALTVRLKKYF